MCTSISHLIRYEQRAQPFVLCMDLPERGCRLQQLWEKRRPGSRVQCLGLSHWFQLSCKLDHLSQRPNVAPVAFLFILLFKRAPHGSSILSYTSYDTNVHIFLRGALTFGFTCSNVCLHLFNWSILTPVESVLCFTTVHHEHSLTITSYFQTLYLGLFTCEDYVAENV